MHISGFIYLGIVWEESSTMKQFDPPEIWKLQGVLLSIHAGSPNMKISECLGIQAYIYIYIYIYIYKEKNSCLPAIGLMSRVFANGPGDRGSVPGRAIPKT